MTERDLGVRLTVLLIDDDPTVLKSVSQYLKAREHNVIQASGGREGLAALAETPVDIVITDVQMPDMDGFAVLKKVQEVAPSTEVIMITAFGDVERAVRAMREGAFDFLPKPFKPEDLNATLQRTVRFRRLRREKDRYRDQLDRLNDVQRSAGGVAAIIGASGAMRGIREQIGQVARASETSVLVGGETGTGKELVARAIHYESERSDEPFVAVDCSAIPEQLFESTFYGHVRGAFTDAKGDRVGHFEAADGGTLFLDEIGEMSAWMQAKLLRTLEERCVQRVGETREIPVDVRVVAATNRDLPQAIAAGTFRQDLYYRLNAFRIHVPPLRERPEDIPLLARHFLQRYAAELHRPVRDIDAEAEAVLKAHPFPGNARELRNLMERGAIVCEGAVLSRMHVHLDPVTAPPQVEMGGGAPQVSESTLAALMQDVQVEELALEEVERAAIEEALRRAAANQVRAAKLLGLSRDALRRRMVKYGLLD